VSKISIWLFRSGRLQPEMDFLGCVVNVPPERIALRSDVSFNVSSETLLFAKTNGLPGENGGGAGGKANPTFSESSHLHPQHAINNSYAAIEQTPG
ncbi:unnamed protein product, partial [Mesorhabditis spiculigera]